MVIFGVGVILLWLAFEVGVRLGFEVELESLSSTIKVGRVGVGLAKQDFLSIY